jgi:hypothetical protein
MSFGWREARLAGLDLGPPWRDVQARLFEVGLLFFEVPPRKREARLAKSKSDCPSVMCGFGFSKWDLSFSKSCLEKEKGQIAKSKTGFAGSMRGFGFSKWNLSFSKSCFEKEKGQIAKPKPGFAGSMCGFDFSKWALSFSKPCFEKESGGLDEAGPIFASAKDADADASSSTPPRPSTERPRRWVEAAALASKIVDSRAGERPNCASARRACACQGSRRKG